MNKRIVSASPHIFSVESTKMIMLDVIIALIPALVAGTVIFGLRALLLVLTCIASAVVAEYICNRIMKKPASVGDLSAVVTGLLLGLNLPATLPFPMAILGSAIAIVVVKQMFGGLGNNFVNPAIAARIVLMVSFPTAMTTWVNNHFYLNSSYNWATICFGKGLDTITGATPLAGGNWSVSSLLFGATGGCIGETYSLALIIGGLYLLIRKVISWHIPTMFIGTVFVLSTVFSWTSGASFVGGATDGLKAVLMGGVMLGAFFMATDYVTSPTNKWGKIIFGIGCGLITVIIRRFGNMNEGVSFSIILMNILTPHLSKIGAKVVPFGLEGENNE